MELVGLSGADGSSNFGFCDLQHARSLAKLTDLTTGTLAEVSPRCLSKATASLNRRDQPDLRRAGRLGWRDELGQTLNTRGRITLARPLLCTLCLLFLGSARFRYSDTGHKAGF